MLSKQTKIVATISDRRCDVEFIRELYQAGMNVVRLNTAHQSPAETLKVVNNIRKVSESIGILIDTKGPEIRTAGIEEKITVEKGQLLTIGMEPLTDGPCFNSTYPRLAEDVPSGSAILIDDGALKMEVVSKKNDALLCKVCNGGVIGNKKSLNVPGVHINLPALTEKDRDYIHFAVENNLDFIAHSFVRNRDDVMAIQSILDTYNSDVKIIAKIENQEGVDKLDEILDCAYGVMIARGDLGVEIPLEQVPLIQKRMILTCIERAKPVITATQMLHSMIDNPRPTRAEVSDVANAVADGTDALMLSGETAYGDYPVEAVNAMATIAKTVEEETPAVMDHQIPQGPHMMSNYLAKMSVFAAMDLNAKLILCDTETGHSARILSSFRGHIPVHACTHSKPVQRLLSLSYGIYASCVERSQSTDEMVAAEFEILLKKGFIKPDELVLTLASTPQKKSGANLIELNTARQCVDGQCLVRR